MQHELGMNSASSVTLPKQLWLCVAGDIQERLPGAPRLLATCNKYTADGKYMEIVISTLWVAYVVL